MHAIGLHVEAWYARPLLDEAAECHKIGAVDPWDGRAAQRDEARAKLSRRLHHVMDELVVIAQDGIALDKACDEDEAVVVIPARLVVRVVGGVAT